MHDMPGSTSAQPAVVEIFLLNCVAAFILAFAGDPPLPKITLNGSTTAEGRLVAHADGIWYVLDDNGKLVGIPDENAGRVLVFPD
jgi:prophage tail gpP-like protein